MRKIDIKIKILVVKNFKNIISFIKIYLKTIYQHYVPRETLSQREKAIKSFNIKLINKMLFIIINRLNKQLIHICFT